MNHEHSTAKRILQELIGYFLEHSMEDLKMKLTVNDKGTWMEIEGRAAERPADLESLTALLQVERQHEIDDYQECLMGMHREEEDYQLVGMSVDSAEVTYQDETLKIKVYRKNLY